MPDATDHEAMLDEASRRSAREEFSCPCCGTPTDSSYCAACDAAECGEQHVDSPRICNAKMKASGHQLLGPCYTQFAFAGGNVRLVRIDLWRRADGERSFGGILEVLS